MSSPNEAVGGRSFWGELLGTAIYKRNQGRMVRQVTCLAIWTAVALGAWRFYETFMSDMDLGENLLQSTLIKLGVPGIFLAIGMWFGV